MRSTRATTCRAYIRSSWYLHDLDIQIDCYERHNRYLIPFATWSPRVGKPPSIPDPIKVMMKAAGMDHADYDARSKHPP